MNKYNSLLEKYYSQEKWLLNNEDKAQDEHLESFGKTVNQLGLLILEIERSNYTVTDQEIMAGFTL